MNPFLMGFSEAEASLPRFDNLAQRDWTLATGRRPAGVSVRLSARESILPPSGYP